MITRRHALALSGAALAAGTLAACGGSSGSGSSDGGSGGDSIEVFTWWAQGSEKAGLDALVKVFNEQHPEVEFVNGAVAGGALGTTADRIRLGAVTDFIDLHLAGRHWPTFNLADSAIVIGLALVLFDASRRSAQTEAPPSTPGERRPRP